MKLTTMVVVAAVAAAGHAEPQKAKMVARVTVITYDRAQVPWFVMARAARVAAAAFAAVGVEIRWVKGERLGEPRTVASGEMLTVVFDGKAPLDASPEAAAATNLGGQADANVHVFYDRVARFKDRLHMPEFLGNVLAHELTHALEGEARHSSEGLMKAAWNILDHGKMVRGALPFAAVDRELLRAHFQKQMLPAPKAVPAR